MEYLLLVKDFAKRTVHNLGIIAGAAKNAPAAEQFEVTQLINSLLGLIVLQKELQLAQIPATPLADLVKQGWAIPGIIRQHPKTPNLRKLVKYMRHAVAHFNLEFLADDVTHEIYGVKMWNQPPGGAIDWTVDFLVVELRDFVSRFNLVIQGLP